MNYLLFNISNTNVRIWNWQVPIVVKSPCLLIFYSYSQPYLWHWLYLSNTSEWTAYQIHWFLKYGNFKNRQHFNKHRCCWISSTKHAVCFNCCLSHICGSFLLFFMGLRSWINCLLLVFSFIFPSYFSYGFLAAGISWSKEGRQEVFLYEVLACLVINKYKNQDWKPSERWLYNKRLKICLT